MNSPTKPSTRPSSTLTIRRAMSKDFPAIKALIREYPDSLLQNHLPPVSAFFVAVTNGTIIGCCALEVYSKRLAEVRSLTVSSAHQGKGVATQLIEQCLARARSQHIYEVLCITGAPRLFEKQGFHPFNKEKYALFRVLE